MARVVLPIAGAVVGAYFGNPQLGFLAGSLLANAVDPVKTQGPRIGDVTAQTSAEGALRGIVYATDSVTGNVIACGPLILADVDEDSGKGSGSITSNQHCYRTYAVRICEGPIAGVTRVWEDDKLVYDVRTGSLMLAESAAWMFGTGFYLGDEDQMPDSFLVSQVNADEPAHRGSAYMVKVFVDLTDRRGSLPQYRFEAASTITTLVLAKVPNSAFVGAGGGGGAINAGATINNGSTYVPPYAGSVMQMSLALTLDPNVTVTVSVQFNGQEVLNFIESLSGTFVYQLNPGSASVSYTIAIKNNDTVIRNFAYAFTVPHPDPALIGSGYTAYAGNAAIPYYTLPADPFYGILIDSGTLKSAWWGPSTTTSLGGPVSLGSIIADIHARCGIPDTLYDVSELDDEVLGLVLEGDYTGADAVDTLRAPYFFDKSEHDRKIYYPKRGGAVVHTFTIDDLVEVPDTSTRQQASEYPKVFNLFYQDAPSGYATVKATSQRSTPDVRVTGSASAQVPVVLDVDSAAQIAAKMHKVAWAEADGDITFSVPHSFLAIIPSDVVALDLRGIVTRLRIDKADYADGILSWSLKNDRQSAYTSNLTGVPIPPPTLPPSTIVGDTVFAFLDISARLDTEDDLNYYVAGVGANPVWYGWTYQRSNDGGSTYTTVEKVDTFAIIGKLVAAVPAASEFYTDTTNAVSLQLIRATQTIDSISDATFLSEGGAFALEKADGSWEVMQYRDATEDSSGIITLRHLHRGQLNSGADAHAIGARFVMLSRLEHIQAQSAWIGQTITNRAISYGATTETGTVESDTYIGRSQLEWPVASLTLARSGSNVITGTWAPRHRFGTDDAPVASINFTGYRVTLNDGVLPAVTFDVTTPTFSYDASALGSPLTASVSSLNRITGPGPAKSGTI